MTFKESFESAKNWYRELQENATIPDILIVLVGNKSDLLGEIQVSMQEANDFQREIKAEICKEVSAKENAGISELFQEIGNKLYKKHK